METFSRLFHIRVHAQPVTEDNVLLQEVLLSKVNFFAVKEKIY